MIKRNYSDETVQIVSKIFENENVLWNLFVRGVQLYSRLPGKYKIEQFEKIQNLLKININELLDIYKLNFFFVGVEYHVSFSEESIDKAVKFVEWSPAAVETLNTNIEFIWNICLLSSLKILGKKEEFIDIRNTMEKQIASCLKKYRNLNQKAIEKKFCDVAKVFKEFETFGVNYKKEEISNWTSYILQSDQKEQKISAEFEQNVENSHQKQKNTEYGEKITKYGMAKKSENFK